MNLYICDMEVWNCSNHQGKIAAVLKGKTILKFEYPYKIEFTNGTAVEFDSNDDAWAEDITYY